MSSKGARSFMEFASLSVPAILIFCWFSGEMLALLALAGLLTPLMLANKLDRRQK